MSRHPPPTTPATVLSFWLGDAPLGAAAADAQRPRWYQASAALDREIEGRFAGSVRQALAGGLGEWADCAEGALALVILLDQLTRNLFRGTPTAWAGDARALRVAEAAIAAGWHRELSPPGQLFLYHPHHHAEDLAVQERGVALLEALLAHAPEAWRDWTVRRIEGFGRHRDIVARFGRFPHRNAVLGRSSTAAEHDFLAADPNSYGQATKQTAASGGEREPA